ncbi:helix-turn-helix domain-containing protein [Dactylosporangium sp. AC04546]|uniref:TetR/AcrR family transcriptional regulator n=1 Tax=Dactylosporangium sp. AC04546 TaxID=2862460 RepID=UPI001EDFE094|nr:TetR/AcrR family transcriptional regulator [Dactylosporangium sp. AC04546]WVK83658.1 helix-turn-helix domain-containing protein [Dactylosporangium sp. AC04546]
MPRPRTSETADRIRAAALELFAERGVQQASLRDIAERVGITKPALYYHFASREELVRSLVQPLVDDVAEVLDDLESVGRPTDPREILGAYFDVTYRHRAITAIIMSDPSILAHLDLVSAVDAWRRRLTTLLVGPNPTLAERTRIAIAIGGMSDCTAMFTDVPGEDLRKAVLDAVSATLALPSR